MVFLNWICRLWSLAPFFALTRDNNYGYNKEALMPGLRFSVVNLRLGKYTYYLLTFTRKDGKCELTAKEKIILDECQWASEGTGPLKEKEAHIEKLSRDYEAHLLKLKDSEKDVEKEFLGYLQDNLTYRKSLSGPA